LRSKESKYFLGDEMLKRTIFGILVICLALVLATGCGGKSGEEEQGGAAPAGEKLFKQATIGTQPGCSTCHSLEAGVTIVGPSLAGIGSHAGERVSGLSAEEYLRQSILEPNAHLAEGFSANIMPTTWSETLTKEQLDDLVAFLLTLK
jgi:mono/diheme cytochrome c family protein